MRAHPSQADARYGRWRTELKRFRRNPIAPQNCSQKLCSMRAKYASERPAALSQSRSEVNVDELHLLEQRCGRVHVTQRLKVEKDHEAQVFGQGLNFFHIENSALSALAFSTR